MSTQGSAAQYVPELREIRGPSALTGDSRRFWRLLWHMAKIDFKQKYAGSAFGYLWSLMSPLLLFGVLYIVFTTLVRFGGVEHYAATLLMNIMLFQFFTDASSRSMMSIVSRENVVRKLEFPRLVIPLSIVLAATFTLGLNLIVVLGFMLLVDGVQPTTTWLLLPFVVLWLYVLTVGLSLFLAMLYVRFRDIAQIWTVMARILFYGSPILFPIEIFPDAFKTVMVLNPLAPFFAQARVWMVDPSAPTFADVLGGPIFWIYPVLMLASIVALGIWLFDRDAPRVAEQL